MILVDKNHEGREIVPGQALAGIKALSIVLTGKDSKLLMDEKTREWFYEVVLTRLAPPQE